MQMQIKEFAEYTGVSVRTLHYYDEIGLLKPARTDTQTGYRYYDEESVLRMQEILFYRELDFPLKTIKRILSSPHYDKERVLRQQKELLILKKERLERLISAIDSAVKGVDVMKAFDNSKFDTYKAEAQEKWGRTDAWKEQHKKTRNYTENDWRNTADGMNCIFGEFAACMGAGDQPGSDAAQALVGRLQRYITENFYTCTSEILAGLGQMYVLDERFSENINKQGAGTAEFVSEAIRIYWPSKLKV